MTKPLGYSLIYWWCLSLPSTTNFKITTHIEYAELSHKNIYWCLYSKKPISSACFPLKIQWPFYTCHVIYICSLCSWNALTPLMPCCTEVFWQFSHSGLFVRYSWAIIVFCRWAQGSASSCLSWLRWHCLPWNFMKFEDSADRLSKFVYIRYH